ncbi:YbaB/EbfC family nucleoid-associated protein [Streptomyces sp. NPDC060031]|uniref:YbaB/EbfC family nucleoid-associated protein n=1 Tax=Streptomyces sp. NPDC060031 TaxID=3347043 RepID=UPI0036C2EF4F
MGNPMEDRIARSLAEFEERRAQIMDLQREFQTASVTATAKDRSVEVTVDAQGNVTGLRFPNAKYRSLAPAELAAVLMQTMAEARAEVRRQVLEAFQPLSGRRLGEEGGLDWEKLFGPLKEEGLPTPPVRPPSSGAGARSGLADEITEDDERDHR